MAKIDYLLDEMKGLHPGPGATSSARLRVASQALDAWFPQVLRAVALRLNDPRRVSRAYEDLEAFLALSRLSREFYTYHYRSPMGLQRHYGVMARALRVEGTVVNIFANLPWALPGLHRPLALRHRPPMTRDQVCTGMAQALDAACRGLPDSQAPAAKALRAISVRWQPALDGRIGSRLVRLAYESSALLAEHRVGLCLAEARRLLGVTCTTLGRFVIR